MIKMDGYSTHLPLLVASVARTTGNVVEFGCGLYSTPVLHAACLERNLFSYETDSEWLRRFRHLQSDRHQLIHVEQWADASLPVQISVALVDCQPAAARAGLITRLKGRADLIVAHDSEHRLYGYEPVLADFKYRAEWRGYAPWTTVVSDTIPLDFLGGLIR